MACIETKRVNVIALLNLTTGDVAVIYTLIKTVIIAPAYLPHDITKNPPINIIDYCNMRRLLLVIGCDANSHHLCGVPQTSMPG